MTRILIIDDDDEMRLILEHALTSAGYEVFPAADGREGMAALRTQAFDLIMTDLFMPNQEGIETITELRRQLPHVPIIAMSGGNTNSNLMLTVARELGAVRVLEKPFDAETLFYTVENVLALEPRLS